MNSATSPTAIEPPPPLNPPHPVRVALVGGFLGAGKTTALAALARVLASRGLKVAAITNDQAEHLVDTATLRGHGLPVAEVAGGCFCCKFSDFARAAEPLLMSGPDVLLCEPVGSCTDIAATVAAPLKRFYGDGGLLSVTPVTVLVDPTRLRQTVLDEGVEAFAPAVGYIFRKQLEEADIIAVSKADTLSEAEAEHLRAALATRYNSAVLTLSSVTGAGMEAWADALLQSGVTSPPRALAEIDYDTYATGEAVLGWLNATFTLTSATPLDSDRLLTELADSLQSHCRTAGAEIAHLKLSLSDAGVTRRIHLTRTDEAAQLDGPSLPALSTASLTVNARVQEDPEHLAAAVRDVLARVTEQLGVTSHEASLSAFRPGYPRPPYRFVK